MKLVISVVLFLFLIACSDDDGQVCKTIKAFSGYPSPPQTEGVVYDREYIFFYDGITLVKKEEYSLDPRKLISNTEYSYNTKGLLFKKIVTTSNSPEEHIYYEYTSTGIATANYSIFGADTVNSSEYGYFYIENPENKVYHNKKNSYSYKFQNGNLVELGLYEVIEGDTADTFLERYTFDSNMSYTKTLALQEVIGIPFESAAISSDNNIIVGEYIAGPFKRSYSFQYTGNQLTRFKDLNTWHTIDFEYQCD